MTDEMIKELICKAVALAMERIQQGKYAPPTPEDLGVVKPVQKKPKVEPK